MMLRQRSVYCASAFVYMFVTSQSFTKTAKQTITQKRAAL